MGCNKVKGVVTGKRGGSGVKNTMRLEHMKPFFFLTLRQALRYVVTSGFKCCDISQRRHLFKKKGASPFGKEKLGEACLAKTTH